MSIVCSIMDRKFLFRVEMFSCRNVEFVGKCFGKFECENDNEFYEILSRYNLNEQRFINATDVFVYFGSVVSSLFRISEH